VADAHRPLRGDEDLERIFSWRERRKVSQSLTLQYKKVMYLIEDGPRAPAPAPPLPRGGPPLSKASLASVI